MKILITGIGNIFLGDDGFGCEVIRRLKLETLPEGVAAVDFGVRGYDLAFALTDDYDAVILVDATSRGEPAGTVYLMELDPSQSGELEQSAADAHGLNPVSVIQMARSFGGVKGKLYLTACEPEILESADGRMGLSETVQRAVPRALETIAALLGELSENTKTKSAEVAA